MEPAPDVPLDGERPAFFICDHDAIINLLKQKIIEPAFKIIWLNDIFHQ